MDTMRTVIAPIQYITLLACCIPQSYVLDARYVRPEDCTWEPMADSARVSMTCGIHAFESGANPTNFSLIVPYHIEQLAVCCTGERRAFQRSHLADSSFRHLRGLRSLTIERCKFNYLPPRAFEGLKSLRHLTVRTFSSDSGYRTPLKVSPSSLTPLESIESLDLSENNIESLNAGLLCGLDRLAFVNLTRNSFFDVFSMGLSLNSRCRPTVREIKMGHNKIEVLLDNGLASLLHLKQLDLDYNQITTIESGAFAGLWHLERLDISHNRLVALPEGLFQSTPQLLELYIRNNTLNDLPPGLFVGLGQLTMLDLGHNQLATLGSLGTPDSRVDLTQLKVLDLSHNRLTRLDASTFRALVNLRALDLQGNLIDYIGDSTFYALTRLQTLTLSRNYLKMIGPQATIGLSSMVAFQLDNNRLEIIHRDTFKNTSVLQELSLAFNRLSCIPDDMLSLKMLRSLDLSFNGIRDIANASYQGLNQLYALNLMGNKIGNISQGAFNKMPAVRILNLANNRIQAIEQGTFDNVSSLHYLRLDANHIEDVNGLFNTLHDLIMLNISINRIRWFDYALIPVGLQWLDMHDNQIEALGNYFNFEQSLKLRTLDASSNKLIDLDSSSLPNGIEIVYLRNNNIKRIQPFTFLGKHNLSLVDLTRNKLTTLEMAAFRLSMVPSRRPLPEFAIASNPYMCNCHTEWLQRLQIQTAATTYEDSRQYPRFIDLHNIECSISYLNNFQLQLLSETKSSQFLCEYNAHCFPSCRCCNLDGCDCEIVCPAGCTCYHDRTWNSNIIVCSSRQHVEIPKRLPMQASVVYLDGNEIAHLTTDAFIGRTNLKTLFLNNSNVEIIKNGTFLGLQELRKLHLEYNKITRLHGHEFDGLFKLQELYLTDNQISYINNMTFANLKNLGVLHLSRNRLREIAAWSFQRNMRLTEIHMSSNPWTCDCHFTDQLGEFLQKHGSAVGDILQLSCVYNSTTTLPLWEVNVTQCHHSSNNVFSIQRYRFQRIGDSVPMPLIVGSLVLLLVSVTVTVIFYLRQKSLWLFGRYGMGMFHRTTIEEEKLFDAFVSYSKKDETFVIQILAPELEYGNPPYRLCLHYRDLPMVMGYLSEAIEEAVESSRTTIVILSEHFLESEWCRYEFKSAHHEVLNNSNYKLVVIFLGRVSYSDLDPDIRTWLRHSTFLHWGEKSFWDKLRHSLPGARNRKIIRSDLNSVAVHI